MLQCCVICFRRRQSSPETVTRREVVGRPEVLTNGKWNGSSQVEPVNHDAGSPKSDDYEETDMEQQDEPLDRRFLPFMLVSRCVVCL